MAGVQELSQVSFVSTCTRAVTKAIIEQATSEKSEAKDQNERYIYRLAAGGIGIEAPVLKGLQFKSKMFNYFILYEHKSRG